VKKGLTEIVLVLDRSGSMASTKDDAEGGLKEFIQKQKLVPGQCDVTFYRFDEIVERVFECRPIERVEPSDLRLEPRGSTALLDAMSRAINEVGARLAITHESNRPEKVYVVTITDGGENASRFCSRYTLFDQIKIQRDQYQWEFVFIGANQDAIATASLMGISPQYSMSYNASKVGTQSVYRSLSNTIAHSRNTGDPVCFSAQDRTSAMESDDSKAPVLTNK
jgi:hypothetical protein